MWSLPGSPRDVVPAERLFAATRRRRAAARHRESTPPTSRIATFQEEYLDRVGADHRVPGREPPCPWRHAPAA